MLKSHSGQFHHLGISNNQTTDMQAHKAQLVLPKTETSQPGF